MSVEARNLTEKILESHLTSDSSVPSPGELIDVTIDQVLLQDVLGPLVWIEFEALDFEEVHTDVAVTYADHQVYQFDQRDTDTHRYLKTVTQRYGGYYSKPGNGICHQVHRERFIKPGATLLGSDSHSTTMGGFGALGVGAGGLDVAVTMGGEPYSLEMPDIVNVHLTGKLSTWASAKDVVLELLRRLSVKGGIGKIFEFTGPGVETLSVPERCTIANMTTELGATTGLFPSDERTRTHLARLGREADFRRLQPDKGASYDDSIELDLATVRPLIAMPSMPDNVVPVSEVAGTQVDQVLIGSCTNGSYADVAAAASIVEGHSVAEDTDFIVAPASKRASELLASTGKMEMLYAAGVNFSESTCGACIGQGHVPAPDSVSLRSFNRNFAGRSGNEDDAVYLCSPEVAAASAITGEIVDPRETNLFPPSVTLPKDMTRDDVDIVTPNPKTTVKRGETIGHVPLRDSLGERIAGPAIIKLGDNVTTDHIMPASAEVMSVWSDPQACAEYTLTRIDENFPSRAQNADGGWVVAGENYGQGSSRENAALELAVLGIEGVLAKSFARIHVANLVNFGVIPLSFADSGDYDRIAESDHLEICGDVAMKVRAGKQRFTVRVNDDWTFEAVLSLSVDERDVLIAGGKLPYIKQSERCHQ